MKDADLEQLCLQPEDIARIADFFDGDVDAAFEFARKIWLPDARATVTRLARAIMKRDWTSAMYLCDKLREGARCVGAARILQYANEIEFAAKRQKECWLQGKVRDLSAALDLLASLLLDCGDASRPLPP